MLSTDDFMASLSASTDSGRLLLRLLQGPLQDQDMNTKKIPRRQMMAAAGLGRVVPFFSATKFETSKEFS